MVVLMRKVGSDGRRCACWVAMFKSAGTPHGQVFEPRTKRLACLFPRDVMSISGCVGLSSSLRGKVVSVSWAYLAVMKEVGSERIMCLIDRPLECTHPENLQKLRCKPDSSGVLIIWECEMRIRGRCAVCLVDRDRNCREGDANDSLDTGRRPTCRRRWRRWGGF